MSAPIVFFDIAGPDPAAQAAFFSGVFGWNVGAGGQLSVSTAGPLPGTLRADPAEKVLYFGVEDITATLASVVAHGGAIDAPRFVVPGVVILGLFKDPAGNRLGLVEVRDGAPIVP